MSVTAIVGKIAASAPGRAGVAELALARLRRGLAGSDPLAAVLETVRRARFLADRGHRTEALRLAARAAHLTDKRSPELSAILGVEAAITALDGGVDPGTWQPLLTAHMRCADAALACGDWASLEELVDMGLRLGFHRDIQFGGAAKDPLAGLRILQSSPAYQQVVASPWHTPGLPTPQPHPGAAGSPSAPAHPGTTGGEDGAQPPVHLGVVSVKNFNFVRGIIEDYEADARCDVRVLDLADASQGLRAPRRRDLVHLRVQALATGSLTVTIPQPVRDMLAWADTILVEWGAAAAAWMSLALASLPEGDRPRIVVRLHSFEASTAWPQLTSWSEVDTLLTVAPAIRALLEGTVPDLAPATTPTQASHSDSRAPRAEASSGVGNSVAGVRMVTLPNRAELARYALPKEAGAGRTLAMVGWAARRKDPAWALDVLEELRQEDPAWRLLLIGPDFAPDLAGPEGTYAREVSARIAALGGAVTTTGRTSEVPRFLQGAGVIISASTREGTHEGFIEGAASGAVPVCRRWPDVAAWGGPDGLFPASWIVETPAQAATRIRTLAAEPAAWDEEGREASRLMLAQRDWSHVRAHYDAVLLGTD